MDFSKLKRVPDPVFQPGSALDTLVNSNKINLSPMLAVKCMEIGEDVPFTSVVCTTKDSASPNILGVKFNNISGIYTAHNLSLKNLVTLVHDTNIVTIDLNVRLPSFQSPKP